MNSNFTIHKPLNEPPLSYGPGTPERELIKAELARQSQICPTLPLIINGREVYTEQQTPIVMPHDHRHVLANCCLAGKKELEDAIEAALQAKEAWENMPWEHRAAIFQRAASLITGKYRFLLNAATMLGQSKVVYQAEIDTPCEIADFLRFNLYYADQIYRQQPEDKPHVWNRSVYRPLEGFVLAISPFNFTAIGGNLATAPAIMGNTVVWKPATGAALSNYYLMRVLLEAGLPAGVINFIPAKGSDVSKYVVGDVRLAGFHFTGSSQVFAKIWKQVGENITAYRSYPRLVGETGGKDYIFAHQSAEIPALVSAMVRGAFEYQGQKCSALSRCFIPKSLWPEVRTLVLAETARLTAGDVRDFRHFLGAVIDKNAYDQLKACIDQAAASPDAELLCGGYDESQGWFIKPTIILAKKKTYPAMIEELFGPVLTIYVYEEDELEQTLDYCDKSTPYALTGAIFGRDRQVIARMEHKLRHSAGNFYINDKPTGAVVGQQPFGGARGSGTNDKAGSALNLYRWTSVCTVKECFQPTHEIGYPFMEAE